MPPHVPLDELERLLARRSPRVADGVRRVVKDVRPCVRLETSRRNPVPLQGRLLDRLMRRSRPQPILTATASKFGGRPYCEHPIELNGKRFLGQINFSEVAGALESEGCPRPSGMPDAGLLAVDLTPASLSGAIRWYAPRAQSAVEIAADVVAKYEAAITFKGSWSLRGLEWFDTVPHGDDKLWTWMNELEIPNVDEDARGGHKLFGHPNEVLNDHYGLVPVAGRSRCIRDYALIWRIDSDAAARFHFGPNGLYVIIHEDDLARGCVPECRSDGRERMMHREVRSCNCSP